MTVYALDNGLELFEVSGIELAVNDGRYAPPAGITGDAPPTLTSREVADLRDALDYWLERVGRPNG